MDFCICDISAFEYLRFATGPAGHGIKRLEHHELRGGVGGIGGASRAYLQCQGVNVGCLHVLVSRPGERSASAGVRSHVLGAPLPGGSFVRVAPGICSVSPELLFVQMARRLSFARLVLFGFELCGKYTIVSTSGQGAYAHHYEPREQVTSVSRIASYLDSLPKVAGLKRARRALRFVSDGAESPEEAKMVAAACLSTAEGGYGLPLPYMGYRVDGAERFRRCDAYFSRGRVDLEYNGVVHDSADAGARDAQRANALESLGVTVISVTRCELRDPDKFEKIVRRVLRCSGRRLRIRSRHFYKRRAALWTQLFGAGAGSDGCGA